MTWPKVANIRIEHRRERLFELQQHRVVLTGHQQGHVAARSYAAHSHHFPRNIHDVVPVQNQAPVFRKRLAVEVEHLDHVLSYQLARAWVVNQWRMIHDPRTPVFHVRDLLCITLRRLPENSSQPIINGGCSSRSDLALFGIFRMNVVGARLRVLADGVGRILQVSYP